MKLLGWMARPSGPTGAAAVVTGRVLSEQGVPVPEASVWITNVATDEVFAHAGPLAADGSYRIAGVQPGRYVAYCVAGAGHHLAASTYAGRAGMDSAAPTKLRVLPGKTTSNVDFSLSPAGYLVVTVVDGTGHPVSGVTVASYVPQTSAMACWPVTSNDQGQALLAQVPLQSKIGLSAPPGFEDAWFGGTDFAGAAVVHLPAPGGVTEIVATLGRT